MRSFEESNPIAVTVYFLALGGILMFSQSPDKRGFSGCQKSIFDTQRLKIS